MAIKKRIDTLLVEQQRCSSRQRARALIMAGRVAVNGRPCDKPGAQFAADCAITIKEDASPYVSRGGLKLEAGLTANAIDCTGMICLDVGASTGGFTDCLLKHGAAKVFAVDVGYGQLAWSLRQDERVVVIERTNIRSLEPARIPHPIDLVTIDTSFISLKIVVPAVLPWLKQGGLILALIKPQFEVGKGRVGKGGVVKDPALHEAIIEELSLFFSSRLPLACGPVIPSPILGPKGNREFIILLKHTATAR